MEVKAFRLMSEGAPQLVELSTVWKERGEGGAQFWIDVERPETKSLVDVLAPLQLGQLIQRQMSDGRQTPVASTQGDQLLVRLPVFPAEEEQEHSLTLLMAPSVVVTVHDLESATVHRFAHVGIESGGVTYDSNYALLLGVLHAVVRRDLELVADFRASIEKLSILGNDELCDVGLDEFSGLRRCADELTAVLEDQLYCIGALPAVGLTTLRADQLAEHYSAEHRTLKHLTHVLERSTRRLEQIHDQRSLEAQDSTNRRLKVLTIVQAIFVPLTLVTGIYGMNFDYMPELSWHAGYFACLGLMTVISGGSLLVFWRRGWFD